MKAAKLVPWLFLVSIAVTTALWVTLLEVDRLENTVEHLNAELALAKDAVHALETENTHLRHENQIILDDYRYIIDTLLGGDDR